jgi:drug/metabolite transporter (DMT)-like permease
MSGLTTVAAGRASLIIALNPVATLAGSALFFGERLSARKAAGLALALTGATLVIGRGDPLALLRGSVGAGEGLILGAVLSFAAFTLITKRIIAGMSALAATTYASITGTLLLALSLLVTGDAFVPDASLAAWAALVFLGVAGTAIAFVWYSEGVRFLGPSRAIVYTNLVPVAAVVLAWLLLGETLDTSAFAGGALVVAGVAMINAARMRS